MHNSYRGELNFKTCGGYFQNEYDSEHCPKHLCATVAVRGVVAGCFPNGDRGQGGNRSPQKGGGEGDCRARNLPVEGGGDRARGGVTFEERPASVSGLSTLCAALYGRGVLAQQLLPNDFPGGQRCSYYRLTRPQLRGICTTTPLLLRNPTLPENHRSQKMRDRDHCPSFLRSVVFWRDRFLIQSKISRTGPTCCGSRSADKNSRISPSTPGRRDAGLT